jgi:outer membrane protein assembly factor BamB
VKNKYIVKLVTIFVVLIYTGAIVFWHVYSPDNNVKIQNPGADNRPEGTERNLADVVIGEHFMRFAERTSTLTGQWTTFRGSDYKNTIRTHKKIDFSSDFPVIWKFETGEGYAAPVIYNGLVYVLDYDERLSSDMLRVFDLETGTELWRRWYRVPMRRNHGFSRTVPAVSEKYVVTFGPMGHVMCCDRITGELKWTMDLQKQFETEVPHWYAGQCPRIENNQVILAPAGKEILMIGVNVETGEIAWQTPNTVNYKMSHSSIMPMTLHGKKTFVYTGIGGVVGVSAEKNDIGKLLWNVAWTPSVIAPSPVQLSNNQILLTAGYGAGGAVVQVNYSNGNFLANIIDRWRANEGLSSEQQTPILYDQMLITIPPNDGGGIRRKVVAYSTNNFRTPIWESAMDERFGLGPYIVINNYLLAFKDDGELFVYGIGQRSLNLVHRQRIMIGSDAWRPIAYADGYLILGDDHWIYCLKID